MDEREDLEHLLRQGLRLRQPPAEFTARVMAGVRETRNLSPFERRRARLIPVMRWATAAMLLALAGGGYWQQQRQERIAGERARDQLILALRLSAATLNDVQHKVMRSTKGDME